MCFLDNLRAGTSLNVVRSVNVINLTSSPAYELATQLLLPWKELRDCGTMGTKKTPVTMLSGFLGAGECCMLGVHGRMLLPGTGSALCSRAADHCWLNLFPSFQLACCCYFRFLVPYAGS
jgi:hypothetical protein